MSAAASPPRTLVAGVGNIFLGDDGFGPEVARRLCGHELPGGVEVRDYGIRGTHLAFDLLSGWDALILIDTVPPRGAAGTIHVLEVVADDVDGARFDPHGMDPNSVLAGVRSLGGALPPTVLVGCEPAALDEGIGLSPDVDGAVPRAVRTVLRLLETAAVSEDPLPAGTRPVAPSAAGTGPAAEEGGGPPCASASPVG